jgi:hypothetical protein
MSRTTHTSLLRSLSLAGILTAVALAAPPTVHGQEGERALLNQTSVSASGLATDEVPGMPVNGERALLGHFGPGVITQAFSFELLASDSTTRLIDGAQALLGRRTTIEAGRRSVSTSR